MPTRQLTQELLEKLVAKPPLKTVVYSDTSIRGFVLEFRKSASGTWYFRYRNLENKLTYHRIGTTKDMDALLARALAHQLDTVFKRDGNLDSEIKQVKSQKKLKKASSNKRAQKTFSSLFTIKNFFYERYLPYAKLAKQSWNLDKNILEKYFFTSENKTIIEKPIHSIKSAEILKWKNNLSQKSLKLSTCNRILWVIKAVFNCAVKWEVIKASQNPCKDLTVFQENVFQPRYLNSDEAKLLIHTPKEMPENKQAQALQLLLFTGARKNEILSVRWEDVALKNRLMTVVSSSTELVQGKIISKKRTIPLSEDAVELIEELKNEENAKDSPWLFPGRSPDKHLQSVFETWDIVRKQLGFEDVRLQDLRHSYANFLVQSGCSIQGVQQVLGHSSAKVTMRYVELLEG